MLGLSPAKIVLVLLFGSILYSLLTSPAGPSLPGKVMLFIVYMIIISCVLTGKFIVHSIIIYFFGLIAMSMVVFKVNLHSGVTYEFDWWRLVVLIYIVITLAAFYREDLKQRKERAQEEGSEDKATS